MEEEKLRAVYYARCSTEEENQKDALVRQAAEAEEAIRARGWRLVDAYVESRSGTSRKGRREYNRLYEDLEQNRFDVVVIKSQDRLMRNTRDWYLFADRLNCAGKRLYFYLENTFYSPEDALLTGIKAILAEEYSRELADTVAALGQHPSIGCWVPFNEGWGQFDAAGAVEAVRRLDDTRLVDEASGWYDQGGGDVDSLHNYFYRLRVRPRSRVVALSEYGGIAWPMPGHEPPRRAYGYGTAKSRAELTARWKKLQLETVLPQLKKGLSALVYTQVSDVEDEVNGLFTYDRAAIKPDPAAVRAVNQALEAAFEKTVE